MDQEQKIILGDRINKIRLGDNINNQSYTQAEFADLLSVSTPTISNWVRGKRLPQSLSLEMIARLGGITVKELLADRSTCTVEKFKKGVPTVIKFDNRKYILVHPDQYRGNKRK